MSTKKIARNGALLVTVAAATLAPHPAWGQFAQYTQPGSVARGGPEVTRQAFEAALEEAPWQVGPVRLDPWFGVSDVGWSANPLGTTEGADPEGEVRANGGAGLRAHLPTGHSLFWTAHALPSYQWWSDQDGRSRVNETYGAGVFGFFNRLSLEASGRRQEQLGVVSAEVPQEVTSRRDLLRLAGEVRLGFAVSVFAEAAETRTRNVLEDDVAAVDDRLQRLDRDERRLRAGLRYQPRERWSLGLGMEWTESESVGPGRDLSNTGSAPVVDLRYNGPKFWASGAAAFRTLEAEEGSEFRDSDVETYSVALGADGNRLSPAVYARRSLALAVDPDFSHFTTDVVGASLGLPLGYRTKVRLFGELGESEFVARPDVPAPDRVDDITSFGGELSFNVTRRLSVHLGGYRTELDSNLPGQDRVLEVVTSGIGFGLRGFGRGSGSGWL